MRQITDIQVPTKNIGIGLGTILLGLVLGLVSHSVNEMGLTVVLALLIFSAAVVGAAQQTIP